MRDTIWIAIGAVFGANSRYFVSRMAAKYFSASLPWGTLIVNVTGSILLGFFLVWTSERVLADPRWRPLVAVGFCGAYTTFSSYSFETFNLLEQGHYSLAAWNFTANNLLSLLGVVAGAIIARAI
ncbi:MAG TPA: fluoride efflux transporter CrcB [Gammaproteobacteria bacterium]|nr:fluoride efflux transporter CrcB [Gammaproteobacteria bacterium]